MNVTKAFAMFVCGCATGYLVANILMRSKYEEKANEEINAMRDYMETTLREHYENVNKEKKTKTADDSKSDFSTITKKEIPMPRSVENYLAEEPKKDILNERKDDAEVRKSKKPYRIDFLEFGNGEMDSQDEVHFYVTDELITDADDFEIPNPNEVVGNENLDWFRNQSGLQTMYIRNDHYKCDYEVIKYDDAFDGAGGVSR